MKSAHFLIPGDPDTRTGGYLYDQSVQSRQRAYSQGYAAGRASSSR